MKNKEIVRRTLLELVKGDTQIPALLNKVVDKLKNEHGLQIPNLLIVDEFYELIRSGIICPGYNIDSPTLPWYHLTERGQKSVADISRDPSNPFGYLENLNRISKIDAICLSYVREALSTYNNTCYKACAVMIGAACELLIFQLRDQIIAFKKLRGQKPSKRLSDWKPNTVLQAIKLELNENSLGMEYGLRLRYEKFWNPFTHQITSQRNDAGHPASLEPVTAEAVHASLLIFPELVKLSEDLNKLFRKV